MNLTVQQENEAVRVLEQLVQESKNLLPDVSLDLWDNSEGDSHYGSFYWRKITLSCRGLCLESGLYDRCTDYEGCMSNHEDCTNRPRRLQPSAKVVREYGLTAAALKKHLAKLK